MRTESRLRRVLEVLVVFAGLSLPSSGLMAQGLDPCGGDCTPKVLSCGASSAGELAPDDCTQEGRALDLYEWSP